MQESYICQINILFFGPTKPAGKFLIKKKKENFAHELIMKLKLSIDVELDIRYSFQFRGSQ